MKNIYASEYGILPGKSCAILLNNLLSSLRDDTQEKTLIFENGTYVIDADALTEKELHITNTIGDSEYKSYDHPHVHKVGLYFDGLNSLTVEGNGCTFLMDGKMTNAAITCCENIKLQNIEFKTKAPNLHSLRVVKVKRLTVDFELDSESQYNKMSGKYFWYGKGWKMGFFDWRIHAWWTLRIKPNAPDCVFRSHHPFMAALKIRETSPYHFTASYASTKGFTEGEIFNVYDARRMEVGIFAQKSSNIILENVAQRFNYSLAFVAQNCHDITLRELDFTSANNERKIASLADFVQICMCSGTAVVEGCRFEGAGDDVLNIHGIHLLVDKVEKNHAILSFCEKQTFGFNPLRSGHNLRFINKDTLLEQGMAKIEGCKLVDPYHVEVICDSDISKFLSCAAEDADLNPDLIFRDNYMSLIPTRGLLITTRGKVLVENNVFHSNYMSSIDVADDAKNWYESGMVRDVTIKGNCFESNYDRHLFIHPENCLYAGAVHKNITVEDNFFNIGENPCFDIKCTDNIAISNNEYTKSGGTLLITDRCENVTSDI